MSDGYKQPGQANSKRKQKVAKQTQNYALASEEAVRLLFPGTNINRKSHFCSPTAEIVLNQTEKAYKITTSGGKAASPEGI